MKFKILSKKSCHGYEKGAAFSPESPAIISQVALFVKIFFSRFEGKTLDLLVSVPIQHYLSFLFLRIGVALQFNH